MILITIFETKFKIMLDKIWFYSMCLNLELLNVMIIQFLWSQLAIEKLQSNRI